MSPIPYSFQEQENTRDIPREGRHQVGHLLASVPSLPLFFIPLIRLSQNRRISKFKGGNRLCCFQE